MRFITEFEIMEHEKKEYHISDRKKAYYEPKFAKKITDAFGWQNPVEGDWRHYKLEIEVFPMDKWVEFKRNVIILGSSEALQILDMIMELESFGKPSGDAITNQQP